MSLTDRYGLPVTAASRAAVDPFGGVVLDDDDIGRVHGNDERVSIDNIVAGVRAHPEMLPAVAGA